MHLQTEDIENSKDETAPHAAQVAASQAILDRAYGKAPTFSSTDIEVKRAVDMTNDELAAIASGAHLEGSEATAVRHGANITTTSIVYSGYTIPYELPNMLETRFICVRKSWHVDPPGERGTENGNSHV